MNNFKLLLILYQVKLNLVNGSIIMSNLRMNKLYGVTICAVVDPQNLTFPEVRGVALGMKSKANKIFIDPAGLLI